MSSFPFYQIGCIIRRVQFKHIRFQVVKLSVWFTSGLQYCSFYIIYSDWKADSVAFVVPPCVYIRVYSTVVIKIYAKVLFAITFFSVAGVMHPKKVWVLFIQIYKFTIKWETRKKMRDHDFKEFHREYKKSFTWITHVGLNSPSAPPALHSLDE